MLFDENKRKLIADQLIKLAKKKSTIGYMKLSQKLNLGVDFSVESQMNEFYDALDKISYDSFKENGTLLGIIVVNKMRNRPGPRFFKGAEKILGIRIEEQDDFAEHQTEKLFTCWGNA